MTTNSTRVKSIPCPEHAPGCRLLRRGEPGKPGLIRFADALYVYEPSDFQTGVFLLQRRHPVVGVVNCLVVHIGDRPSCDCDTFFKRGRCGHVAGLRALLAKGCRRKVAKLAAYFLDPEQGRVVRRRLTRAAFVRHFGREAMASIR